MSTGAGNNTFTIAADHPSLPRHFPGAPIVPGVVILEQVLAMIETRGPTGALRLPQVKFLRPLLPGERAQVDIVEADPRRWRFRVLRDGVLLASGEVVAG